MNDAFSDLVSNVLLVVGALFPIVNPIGNTPIFLTSIFIGTHILVFFGISLPVVQVGGGLIVISTAGHSCGRSTTTGPRPKLANARSRNTRARPSSR